MNETIEKFGYPGTLVADYAHWVVLLRPKQATLGALVLACKEDALAFGDISQEAASELKRASADIEAALTQAFSYDKINYLMLMMVDPQVHFHVLPRYSETREFQGRRFEDPGWPAVPNLGAAAETDSEMNAAILAEIKRAWPA
ncbi:MAG: HIT family protein [Rhodovibrionaceae bacterium]